MPFDAGGGVTAGGGGGGGGTVVVGGGGGGTVVVVGGGGGTVVVVGGGGGTVVALLEPNGTTRVAWDDAGVMVFEPAVRPRPSASAMPAAAMAATRAAIRLGRLVTACPCVMWVGFNGRKWAFVPACGLVYGADRKR